MVVSELTRDVERAVAESIVAEPEPKIAEPKAPKRGPQVDPRVLRGALRLDEMHPGWAKRIDLDTFNLACAGRCVVGQLFGDYTRATVSGAFGTNYPGDEYSPWDSGAPFGVVSLLGPDDACEEYERLEADWRLLIEERQAHQDRT